jgi:hypothetical protein
MTLDDARKSLKLWIGDMEALRHLADLGNPEARPFVEAFEIARDRALEAAKEYVKAAKEP